VLYEGLFASLHEDILLKVPSFSPHELVDTTCAIAHLQRRFFHDKKLGDEFDGGSSEVTQLILPGGDEVMDRIALAITSHWDLARFSVHQLACLAWAYSRGGEIEARTTLMRALGIESTKRLTELVSTRNDVYYAGVCRQWVEIYLGMGE
jgi:hypothetical protein